MDPVTILDEILIRHLDDAAAQIEEVVAQLAGERPSLERVAFDRIEPCVCLLRGVALQHVEELGGSGHAVGLEEVQM